jgi:hypothetical protein
VVGRGIAGGQRLAGLGAQHRGDDGGDQEQPAPPRPGDDAAVWSTARPLRLSP